LNAYIGLLLLATVYRSHDKSTESVWDACKGQSIFRAMMFLEKFEMISMVIRIDDHETCSRRCEQGRFVDFQDKHGEIFPNLYSPSMIAIKMSRLWHSKGSTHFINTCQVNLLHMA